MAFCSVPTTTYDAVFALMLMHQNVLSTTSSNPPVAVLSETGRLSPLGKRMAMVQDPVTWEPKRRRLDLQQGRSVSFAPEVDRQMHFYEQVEAADVKNVWWAREELEHIHRRERSMVKVLACWCVPYVEQLDRCMEMAASSAVGNWNGEMSHVWLANSPGRGLEHQVMKYLGGNHHSSRRVIRKVLDTYKKLQEYGDLIGSPERRREILRARCEEESSRKVMFAQLLAVGDSRVAQLEK